MLKRPSSRPGPLRTGIDAVLDPFDYAVQLIGIDHIGIGPDFDGVDGELADGLRSPADYPNLIASLQARGYQDADIAKILDGWAQAAGQARHYARRLTTAP